VLYLQGEESHYPQAQSKPETGEGVFSAPAELSGLAEQMDQPRWEAMTPAECCEHFRQRK
jgi:hypothetical protein